jgi:steroid 5-alpha reductase family enzyme
MFPNLALILGMMFIVWLASVALRDASIIDPFWGLGFVVLTWSSWWQAEDSSDRAFLLVLLTSIWGGRLAAYLTWRNRGHGEDRRYRAMRDKHGARFKWISLFTVFGLQAVLLWIIAWPLQVAIDPQRMVPLYWPDAIGFILWLVGVLFESIGDWQLTRFQANPANQGKVLDRGLWRYTRHPNYFGDFCVWWGIYWIAAFGGAWWTIISPLLMSFLLMKVSGVSLLEKDISDRRPDYQRYQMRTSTFFPLPPK